ncbi:ThiF family adenylyltransferase [Ferrovibrio xuzhouensis]|uniref:ThiF family adenylyltransferase n=1 Tax=Ferrovibrio xuzhouensis TaxID=1576914 RepID=A0ABV7VAT8_9PROT
MTSLVFHSGQFGALKERLLQDAPNEAAALLVCASASTGSNPRLLVHEIVYVPSDAYLEQTPNSLKIRPEFIAPVLKRARGGRFSLVLVHTHPHASEDYPSFSRIDDRGEAALIPAFFRRAPDGPHGALVIGRKGFQGRFRFAEGRVAPVDKIVDVSRVVSVHWPTARLAEPVEAIYDRNVRAFGKDGQAVVKTMKVGVVGGGGTGSVVIQNISHLGTQSQVHLDFDTLEDTNLNRVVGSRQEYVGLPKVTVSAVHARSILPECDVIQIRGSILDEKVARKLLDCDFIFCCTDSHGSRAVLNQLAYQYLIPVIDIGVRIHAEDGVIKSMSGRVQMLAPGLSCLQCEETLNPEQVRRDFLSEEERRADPYIPKENIPQPAVISLNSTVSSMAVTMFLAATVGIPSAARHLVYRIMDGSVRPVRPAPLDGCLVCSPDWALAKGDRWEMIWRRALESTQDGQRVTEVEE